MHSDDDKRRIIALRGETGGEPMKKLVISTVVLCIVMMLASFACKKGAAPSAVIGNRAPSFTITDIDGKKISLGSMSGKVVVLDFWATWCAPCKASTRELEKLNEKYKDRNIVILGISMDEGKSAVERVKEFAGNNGLTYRMLIDDGLVSKAYSVRNIPALFILDRQQRIIKIYPGYLPDLGKMIENELDDLLKG